MNIKIWLSSPHMGKDELSFVKEAFDTNWIAPLGPNVDGFETALEEYSGIKHAAALSSGTAAIHLALILLGVKTGDEVICQSMTFSASANPIAYLGATPIFVDSEKDTWNICPHYLEEAIKDRLSKNKKVKAIIVVHLYGMPAKMEEILSISEKYGIPIIEDAAEGLGSSYKERPLGSIGDIGIYSFNGNKIITTSGGGALLSNDKKLVQRARFLATQARDQAPHYQHSEIGYNYRMSNISAGIGRGQMKVLSERVNQRRHNYQFYRQHLSDITYISFLDEPENFYSNRWLTTIIVNPNNPNNIDREIVREFLLSNHIESRPLWKPLHLQPVFSNHPYYGDKLSEGLFKDGLCLPSGSNLSLEELGLVVYFIKQLFEENKTSIEFDLNFIQTK